MHHILLLNLSYPPDQTATAKIIKDLVDVLSKHYKVTVLCGRPSYQPLERHPYYLLRRECYENITIERVGSTAFDRRNPLGRAANYFSYLMLSFLRSLVMRPKPDAILSMSDPPGIAIFASVIAFLQGSKFIYNIRDLYPDVPLALGLLRPRFLGLIWEKLHRLSLKRANLIIVLGEDMRERIIEKGIRPEKVVVVRDGTKRMEPPANLNHEVVHKIRQGFSFVVICAGNLGYSGAWEVLIEALKQINEPGIGLVFVGDGVAKKSLEEKSQGVQNIRFLPFQPAKDVPYVLGAADLHIVAVRHKLEGLVVPSKLYPLLMIGKPVLAIANPKSDIVWLVQKHQCGLTASSNNPQDIAQAILWAYQHPEELAEMGRNAYKVRSLYEWDKVTQEFLNVLEAVIK